MPPTKQPLNFSIPPNKTLHQSLHTPPQPVARQHSQLNET
jgi:hypothetical protein